MWEGGHQRERERASFSQTSKVKRIVPVLKFCGEWRQGPWCWLWTCLLSFRSSFLLLLSLSAFPLLLSPRRPRTYIKSWRWCLSFLLTFTCVSRKGLLIQKLCFGQYQQGIEDCCLLVPGWGRGAADGFFCWEQNRGPREPLAWKSQPEQGQPVLGVVHRRRRHYRAWREDRVIVHCHPMVIKVLWFLSCHRSVRLTQNHLRLTADPARLIFTANSSCPTHPQARLGKPSRLALPASDLLQPAWLWVRVLHGHKWGALHLSMGTQACSHQGKLTSLMRF